MNTQTTPTTAAALHLRNGRRDHGRGRVNAPRWITGATSLFTAAMLFVLTGCETVPPVSNVPGSEQPPAQVLQAGDVIRVAFPGASTMDTTQQIRRDGKLNLAMLGEVEAAGRTPAALEKDLVAKYADQLVSKEVKVTVVSSAFAVYVNGAVMKPGKVVPDHPLTAFDAIMESGGFDYARANTRAVRVIRTKGSETQTFTIDLKGILEGKNTKPFYLESGDTVYVPEKLQLF